MFDKNVPIPKPYSTRRKYELDAMGIGDSLFVPDVPLGALNAPISRCRKNTGYKFVTRRENNGIRVWRIE